MNVAPSYINSDSLCISQSNYRKHTIVLCARLRKNLEDSPIIRWRQVSFLADLFTMQPISSSFDLCADWHNCWGYDHGDVDVLFSSFLSCMWPPTRWDETGAERFPVIYGNTHTYSSTVARETYDFWQDSFRHTYEHTTHKEAWMTAYCAQPNAPPVILSHSSHRSMNFVFHIHKEMNPITFHQLLFQVFHNRTTVEE